MIIRSTQKVSKFSSFILKDNVLCSEGQVTVAILLLTRKCISLWQVFLKVTAEANSEMQKTGIDPQIHI